MASTRHLNRGVVLLSVLLIVALLAAVAYQLLARHSLTVAQARYSFSGDQSLAYALGAETLARQVLFEDWSQSGQGVDNLFETWAQPLAPFEIENGIRHGLRLPLRHHADSGLRANLRSSSCT